MIKLTNWWQGSQFSAYLFYHGHYDHKGERKYCGQRRHGRVGEGKLQNINKQLILCWHWNGAAHAWRGSRSTFLHKWYERTNLLCILLTFCATVLECWVVVGPMAWWANNGALQWHCATRRPAQCWHNKLTGHNAGKTPHIGTQWHTTSS